MFKDNQAALKNLGLIGIAFVVILVVLNVLNGGQMGYGYGMYYGRGVGLDFNGLLASILITLIKILWFVLIVSLVIGSIIALKKYQFDFSKIDLFKNAAKDDFTCPGCGNRVSSDYKFCPVCRASLRVNCAKCGKEMQGGWSCCPSCGTAVTKEN